MVIQVRVKIHLFLTCDPCEVLLPDYLHHKYLKWPKEDKETAIHKVNKNQSVDPLKRRGKVGGLIMNINEILLHQSKHLVEAMDKAVDDALPQEIAEVVKFHSKGAAVAALASGWIPGAGGVAAVATSAGFIWSMYGRIGSKIGLPFGKNVLKSLASGVATNLAASVVGAITVSTALSLVPGIGSISADLIMGATCYALTLASGYVYLKIMTKLFTKRIDLSTVSEQELKDMAASTAKESDIREVLKHAKSDFKTMKKQGEFN